MAVGMLVCALVLLGIFGAWFFITTAAAKKGVPDSSAAERPASGADEDPHRSRG
jgi:hypothetical protein